ncbi:hypothetical protein NQ314_014960, partial [Rhamnusium bicolor]
MTACSSAIKMSTNSVENEIDKNDQKSDNELEIPMDYSIKHPLQNCWTLWYYENDRTQTWEKNQKEIAPFKRGRFLEGIRPMWEDEANKRGGRWLLSLEKKQRNNELDRYWLDIILCLIGEGFRKHSEEVCGAVVNIRQKGDKIGKFFF